MKYFLPSAVKDFFLYRVTKKFKKNHNLILIIHDLYYTYKYFSNKNLKCELIEQNYLVS